MMEVKYPDIEVQLSGTDGNRAAVRHETTIGSDMSEFTTHKVGCWSLQPGDEYVIGVNRRGVTSRESRTILAVIQLTSNGLRGGGALLDVRDAAGNVYRSHMIGTLDVIEEARTPCELRPLHSRWMTDPDDRDFLDPAARWCVRCGCMDSAHRSILEV